MAESDGQQPIQPIVVVQRAMGDQRQNNFETTIERPRGNFLTALLILFFPFIGAWVVLFGRNYKKGFRIFAIVWSLLIAFSVLGGSTSSSPSSQFAGFAVMIAPVLAYIIKIRRRQRFE